MNDFQSQFNNKDDLILSDIITEIYKYDIDDFLARLSALKLYPENQEHDLRINYLIKILLSQSVQNKHSTNKMSAGLFKKIVTKLSSLSICIQEDPPEIPFIDRILFYGNYYIFNGINSSATYSFQMFINSLFKYSNSFDKSLLRRIANLYKFLLVISDNISKQLNYSIRNLSKPKSSRDLYVPDSKHLEYSKEIIIFSQNDLHNMLQDDYYWDKLTVSKGEVIRNKVRDIDKDTILDKPFVKLNNGQIVLADITILASLAIHLTILTFKNAGLLDELFASYNQRVWNDCLISFKNLGHKKLLEKSMGINLIKKTNYREVLLNVCNDKIMLVMAIFDDGMEYNENSLFKKYVDSTLAHLIDQRNKYFTDIFTSLNIPNSNIFQCLIISSIGRVIAIPIKTETYTHFNVLHFQPSEIKYISINERNIKLFLPRYIISKSSLITSDISGILSELNNIEIYTNNDYSFYINDDFNPHSGTLFIAPGDSVDYIIKALKREDRHLVNSFCQEYYCEVIRNEDCRPIYIDLPSQPQRVRLLVEHKNISIWVVSSEFSDVNSLNIYYSMVDMLSYWLAECNDLFDHLDINALLIIELVLEGEPTDCYKQIECGYKLENTLSLSIDKDNITIKFTPNTMHLLNCKTNKEEAEFTKYVLTIIERILGVSIYQSNAFEKIFSPVYKKKFFTLDFQHNPYLKPTNNREFRRISAADENNLLNEIGDSIIDNEKWTYGRVKDSDKGSIFHYVTDYLYSKLQSIIANISPTNIYELIYNDIEIVTFNIFLAQHRFDYDIACYPERENEIVKNYSELNKVSIALKFLMEYVAAVPPSGNQILSEMQYEELLAITSLIIEWAYTNDLYHYKICDTPIEILKSNRIGMKKEKINYITAITTEARTLQLKYNSLSDLQSSENDSLNPVANHIDDLNKSFSIEYSYSLDDWFKTVLAILDLGNDQETEVKKIKIDDLIPSIIEIDSSLTPKIVNSVINDISLKSRDDFMIPPIPYRKEDVYPWRFNRELSLTRRPIIENNNFLIWGNRYLYHSILYTLDLIGEGKLKARTHELQSVIGIISNERGDEFNNKVYKKIKSFNKYIVDKNLKKINRKKIANDNGQDLGDIDVLYISEKKKKIVLVETKDFYISKNPYELYFEYTDMFFDKPKKVSFATKHHRRAEWVKNHLSDVLCHFGLKNDHWTVKSIFIVNEALISNDVYNTGEKIVPFLKISDKLLENI